MARGFRDDDDDARDLFGRRRADDTEARKSDLVDIDADLRRETPAAWLIFDGKREAWIPKSQGERDGKVFTVPAWLAKEKGLV